MINCYNPLGSCMRTRLKKRNGTPIGSPPTSSKKSKITSSWQMMFILMFAVFSGSMFAQTITIGGAGTASGAFDIGNPIYRSSATSANNFSQSVHLLTAGQLSTAGLTSAKDITAMAFYKTTANTLATGRTATLKIYMKNSNASALGTTSTFATWVTGATLVYSNSAVGPADLAFSGAVPFTFSTPFQYDGSAGIEIAVDWSVNAGTNPVSTGSFLWSYNTSTAIQTVGASSSIALTGTNLSSSLARSYRMNLTLTNSSLPLCTGTPAPGNVTGATAACSGVNFTLGLQNATSGLGVTYLWQSADDAGFSSGLATVGGNSPTLTTSQTAAKFYRCTVTCSGGGSGVATALNVAVNPFYNCYCSAGLTTSGGLGDEIVGVTIDAYASGVQGNVAPWYTAVSNTPITITRGTNVPVTITMGSDGSQQSAVWIDVDQSGTFDASENVALSTVTAGTNGTASYSLAIPNTATLGLTRMRIRGAGDNPYTAAGACTGQAWGETEDYLVNIIANTNCAGAPAPGNTVSTVASTCVGVPFTLSLQNPTIGSGITYVWESADDAGFTTGLTTLSSTTSTQVIASQTSAKYYRCTVACSFGSSTTATAVLVGQNAPTACYCTPTTTLGCTDGDVIAKVVLNTLSNDSGTGCPSGTVGYSDYTANPLLTTTLQAGSSYSCIVSAGQYDESYAAWIDYNDDGVFANPSERIGFTSTPVTGSGLVGVLGSSASFPIVLSCAPSVGVHRLRVRAMFSIAGSAMTPCGNNTYGEVEDYLITISAADPCPKPTSLAAGTITASGATATWVQGCAETVWDAHVDVAGTGAPTALTTLSNPGVTSATAAFSGLSASTNYEYYVRSVCDAGLGVYSTWAGPFAFRTQGVPTCATALVPADAATGVALDQVISWTAPVGADPVVTGYDVYFGTAPGAPIVSTAQVGTTYTPALLDLNTTYYWKVVAKNAAGDAVGCAEQSFTTTSIVTYCTPSISFGCGDGDVIAKVVLNTLSNDSGTGCPSDPVPGNQGSGQNGNGYSDYTGNALLTTELQAGSTYNCIVSAGQFSESYAAWIDYNDNGFFDASERIGFTNTAVAGSGVALTLGSSASFPIVVSCSPPVGVHRLRVRAEFSTPGSAITPCGASTYGEVEDYLITITAADPCPKPSTLASTLSTTTSATLGWRKGCVETEWDVHVQQVGLGAPSGPPSNPGVTTTSAPNFGTLAVSGLTDGFAYEFYVRAVCDAGLGVYSDWTGPFTFISRAPGCTTLNSPANLAVGVAVGTVPLSWSAPAVNAAQSAATSYDVFFSTTPNSAVTPLGNTTATTVNITNVTYGTYYVQILAKNAAGSAVGCIETSFKTVPDAPVVSSQTFCVGATVANLVATGDSIQWYDAFTGGSLLSSATVLTSGAYYASQTVDGIESARAAVSVTIDPLSVSGTVALSSTSICPGNTATLSLTGSTGVVQWQYSLNGTSNWIDITGTSSTSINTGAIPVTTYYRAVVTSGVCSSATSNVVMLTVVIPPAPGTSPQILPLTSIVSNLQATGTGITWYATPTGGLPLSTSTALVSGNTYYASQTISGCEGESRGASLVTLSGIPASKIRSSQCGSTLAATNTQIAADIVTGATMYRFQVTQGATVSTLELNKYNFNLTQLPIAITYGTTYSIRVAARLAGNWGPYGTTCSVSTPTIVSPASVPTTKIRVSDCGTTLISLSSEIHADLVTSATAYRFEITNGATVTTYESPIYYFNLTNIVGATYATTYSIKAAAQVLGIWGNYGAPCLITTPSLGVNTVPLTRVRPAFCGITLASLATKIPAVIISGSEGYRFEITRAGVITVFDTTSYNPTLAETGAIVTNGTVYAIRVAAKVNGVYGNYGVSCNVTTPGSAPTSKQALEPVTKTIDFNLTAYPNPFNSAFNLQINGANNDKVSILVFDMMGRQIENKLFDATEIENVSLGQNYSSGIYNVIVTQGMNTKSVRLVKK